MHSVSRWVLVLAALASLAVATLQTPVALVEIRDLRALAEHGEKTVGTVKTHFPKYGKYARESFAEVTYEVNGRTFSTTIVGSDAQPEKLPLGIRVEVIYLPDAPQTAQAKAGNAETNRLTVPEITGIWAIALALSATAIYSYRRKKQSTTSEMPKNATK